MCCADRCVINYHLDFIYSFLKYLGLSMFFDFPAEAVAGVSILGHRRDTGKVSVVSPAGSSHAEPPCPGEGAVFLRGQPGLPSHPFAPLSPALRLRR